jgi:glycosyltransferase involved in cell wall biosynthesis
MKISVIIPAYNAERFISEAIQSCLNQTFAPHEIIVVDDGSSDRTAEIAESYAPLVNVIRLEKNVGVAEARNRAIKASTGDWIAFLDADDYFLPEKLELQRRCALENPRAVLIYGSWRVISVDGEESPGRFTPPSALMPMLRFRCNLPLLCILLRRDAVDSVGGFDASLRRCQDWDLWLRIAARFSVTSFAAVPEPLAIYRRVAGGLSYYAMPYFHQRAVIVAKGSCLFGLSGISRFLWRRRISAYNYFDTSETLREEHSFRCLPFMLMSFLVWPFPCHEMPNRWKIAIVMTLQTCERLCRSAMKVKKKEAIADGR